MKIKLIEFNQSELNILENSDKEVIIDWLILLSPQLLLIFHSKWYQ